LALFERGLQAGPGGIGAVLALRVCVRGGVRFADDSGLWWPQGGVAGLISQA